MEIPSEIANPIFDDFETTEEEERRTRARWCGVQMPWRASGATPPHERLFRVQMTALYVIAGGLMVCAVPVALLFFTFILLTIGYNGVTSSVMVCGVLLLVMCFGGLMAFLAATWWKKRYTEQVSILARYNMVDERNTGGSDSIFVDAIIEDDEE